MSLLFKNLRIHQIFGANTDVGKTIFSTALVRATAASGRNVLYLKPVSTGPLSDADDRYINAHSSGNVVAKCLYQFDEPLSPHLAAKDNELPDETLISSIANFIRRHSRNVHPASMFVETAGGVHSPVPSGTTQVDAYRPLFLPTILVGDSRLGGISSTISAYESLVLRGYIIDSILLFRDDYYRNWEYLHPYFAERGVHVSAFPKPPERIIDNDKAEAASMNAYFEELSKPSASADGIHTVLTRLQACHENRICELDSMAQRTMDSIWWPFVQHGLVKTQKDVTVIDSAWGDFFSVYNTGDPAVSSAKAASSFLHPKLDGSASWWTQAFGHAHPNLTLAAAAAAGRYGHVMFPQATHAPALMLAEQLLQDDPGRGWASRVFFSDDGSTGMEVALKMALRAYTAHQKTIGKKVDRELGVIGLKGSYHGDTIGAMDACEEGVYTCEWHSAKGFWFDPPSISIRKGKVIITLPSSLAASSEQSVDVGTLSEAYDVNTRLSSPLANIYRAHIERQLQKLRDRDGPEPAALVLEPLVLGAGGMIFVDPLFQRVLVDVVRGFVPSQASASPEQWHGLPVIFDEVFVGLYRLGMKTCIPVLGVTPDIAVYAKILTGGLVPLSVTLASNSIFRAFGSDSKADCLLHGHSYTAHAVGCQVASEALNLLRKLDTGDAWDEAKKRWATEASPLGKLCPWSLWNPSFVGAISSLALVEEAMTLGTVLVIKFRDSAGGYVSHSAKDLLKMIEETDDVEMSAAPGGSPFGIHFRTLGNVAYFMTSLTTPPSVIQSVEDRIWHALQSNSGGK